MQYYVPRNWVELLNEKKECPILTSDGQEIGGTIKIYDNHPYLDNMFGYYEAIPLHKIRLDEDMEGAMDVYFTCAQSAYFYCYGKSKELTTEWFCEEYDA